MIFFFNKSLMLVGINRLKTKGSVELNSDAMFDNKKSLFIFQLDDVVRQASGFDASESIFEIELQAKDLMRKKNILIDSLSKLKFDQIILIDA